jgi:hypothetical protein
VIEDDRATGGDSPHCKFLVTGCSKLSDSKNIQGELKFPCDFRGNDHAPAWKAEDDGVIRPFEFSEQSSKMLPGFKPIGKTARGWCVVTHRNAG